MPDPQPLALVGCGAIARAYAQALERVPELRLVAVVDPDPRARADLAARLGVPGVPSVGALLHGGPEAAAALVLTPPDTHEPVATELLAAGLHVLCEKPLSPTVESAARMLAAARAAGRRLMLGSKFRYTPDVVAARRLLDEGRCGEAVLYENVFCSHVDMSQRWNSRRERSGGGVLMDNGCHSVDLARFLLGPIERVQAHFGRTVQAIDVEDTAQLSFTCGGTLGTADLSWSLHKETSAYVRIHGARGTIEIGWQQSRWKTRDGEWQVFGNGYDKVAAFEAQLRDFAKCTAAGRPGRIGDDDAMAAVVAIDCAYRSVAAGTWVDVPREPCLP